MSMIVWDGYLPLRRYAIFRDILRGDYAIVVKGEDIGRAEKWGGFVSWLGGARPPTIRAIRGPNAGYAPSDA
jgi:hypothetical protein